MDEEYRCKLTQIGVQKINGIPFKIYTIPYEKGIKMENNKLFVMQLPTDPTTTTSASAAA